MKKKLVLILHGETSECDSLATRSLSWLADQLSKLGYESDWCLTNEFETIEKSLQKATLVIVGELRPGADLSLASRLSTMDTMLVLFNHGYGFCSIETRACGNCAVREMCRDSDRVAIYRSLAETASLLIYLSPLHRQASESFVGRYPEKTTVLAPPNITKQSPHVISKSAVAFHDTSDRAEWHNLLSYAHENPQIRLDVLGSPQETTHVLPVNLFLHADSDAKHHREAMLGAGTFVSLPSRPIPFDENSADFILNGKNVVTNSSVGLKSFPTPPISPSELEAILKSSSEQLIQSIQEKLSVVLKPEINRTRYRHPLLWCHRLGLGDTINILPFASALQNMSADKEMTWVAPRRHMELLREELPLHFVAAEDFDINSAKDSHDIIIEISVAMRNPTERFYSGDIIGERWIRIDLARLPTASTSIYESLISFLGRQGIQSVPSAPALKFTSEENSHGRRVLQDANIDPDRDLVVALHPGSGRRYKCWPPKRYASFIRVLKEHFGAKIVLSGGLNENSIVDEVIRHAPGIDLVLNETPLRMLANIFSACSFYIGNDSGPTHMAAACGTPTLALFGRTNSQRWAPTAFWTYVVHAKTLDGRFSDDLNALDVSSVYRGFCRLLLRMSGEPPRALSQQFSSLPMQQEDLDWMTYCSKLSLPNHDVASQLKQLRQAADKGSSWEKLSQLFPSDFLDFANVSGIIGPSWMNNDFLLARLVDADCSKTPEPNRPKIAYVIESGYQHVFPVLSMLETLPGPVFTAGQRVAARLSNKTDVFVVNDKELEMELGEHRIDIVLTTSQRFNPKTLSGKNRKRKVVYIGHGDSDKSHGQGRHPKPSFVHHAQNDTYDLITVASNHHMERYRNPNKVLTGYLKHDLFLKGNYATTKPNRSWVLWAPGWGRHSSVRRWLTHVVSTTQKLGLQCILHLHPFSQDVDPRIVQLAQAEVLKHDHFRLAYAANILDVMAKCSIMMGDVSTTCYDWLMFDRPILFLDHKGLCIEDEKQLFSVGAHVKQDADLEPALRAAIKNPLEKNKARSAAFNRRFPKQDGRTAWRIKAAVMHAWKTKWSKSS